MTPEEKLARRWARRLRYQTEVKLPPILARLGPADPNGVQMLFLREALADLDDAIARFKLELETP